jgi:hypothetical protein
MRQVIWLTETRFINAPVWVGETGRTRLHDLLGHDGLFRGEQHRLVFLALEKMDTQNTPFP